MINQDNYKALLILKAEDAENKAEQHEEKSENIAAISSYAEAIGLRKALHLFEAMEEGDSESAL